MHLSKNDIKHMEEVGLCKGEPVMHVTTKGGYNMMALRKASGELKIIGQGAHRAIAKAMADRAQEGIEWHESLFKTEVKVEKAANHEPSKVHDVCPKCKSHNIANEGPENDVDELDVTCHDCGHQWTEDAMAVDLHNNRPKSMKKAQPNQPMPDSSISTPENHKAVADYHAKFSHFHNDQVEKKHDLGFVDKHNHHMSGLYHEDAAVKHYQMAGMDRPNAIAAYKEHAGKYHMTPGKGDAHEFAEKAPALHASKLEDAYRMKHKNVPKHLPSNWAE